MFLVVTWVLWFPPPMIFQSLCLTHIFNCFLSTTVTSSKSRRWWNTEKSLMPLLDMRHRLSYRSYLYKRAVSAGGFMPRVRESSQRRRWRRSQTPALTAVCAKAIRPSLPVNTALARSSLVYVWKSFFFFGWRCVFVCSLHSAWHPGQVLFGFSRVCFHATESHKNKRSW